MKKQHITSIISRAFGKFASKEFPRPLQVLINKSYVSMMKIDMSPFALTNTYPSLNKLFTRTLNVPREISKNKEDFISPADSLITEFGLIKNYESFQIKGMSYRVDQLLGSEFSQDEKDSLKEGSFANFYLSPSDYHRYHVPYDLKVNKVVHIPGKLYPVNIPYLNKQVDLFIENERVILECELENGKKIFLVLVGALNVGKMTLDFEPSLQTNVKSKTITKYLYTDKYIKKGEQLGMFMMGSTVLVLAQGDTLDWNVSIDQKIAFSQVVAKVNY